MTDQTAVGHLSHGSVVGALWSYVEKLTCRHWSQSLSVQNVLLLDSDVKLFLLLKQLWDGLFQRAQNAPRCNTNPVYRMSNAPQEHKHRATSMWSNWYYTHVVSYLTEEQFCLLVVRYKCVSRSVNPETADSMSLMFATSECFPFHFRALTLSKKKTQNNMSKWRFPLFMDTPLLRCWQASGCYIQLLFSAASSDLYDSVHSWNPVFRWMFFPTFIIESSFLWRWLCARSLTHRCRGWQHWQINAGMI